MKLCARLIVVLVAAPAIAVAVETSPGTPGGWDETVWHGEVVLSLQRDRLQGSAATESSQVEWIQRYADGFLSLGASRFEIGDSRWSIVEVGGGLRVGPRWLLEGGVSDGNGETGDAPFSHRLVRGSATRVFGRRGHLKLENLYVDVDRVHGSLARLSAGVRPLARLGYELAYSRSLSGNLGTELWTHRLDLDFREARLFAGVTEGDAAPETLSLVGTGDRGGPSTELFVGGAASLGRQELILSASRLRSGAVRRDTVVLALRFRFSRKVAVGGRR